MIHSYLDGTIIYWIIYLQNSALQYGNNRQAEIWPASGFCRPLCMASGYLGVIGGNWWVMVVLGGCRPGGILLEFTEIILKSRTNLTKVIHKLSTLRYYFRSFV